MYDPNVIRSEHMVGIDSITVTSIGGVETKIPAVDIADFTYGTNNILIKKMDGTSSLYCNYSFTITGTNTAITKMVSDHGKL